MRTVPFFNRLVRRAAWAGLAAVLMPVLLAFAAPVPVIFDTDMGNDVDDALALAMLHSLQSRGQCRILAVTLTKNDPLTGPFVDAVNTFYGRGEIPVGVRRDGGVTPETCQYLHVVTNRDGGALRYPHDLDNNAAPEAVALLRRTLAGEPDGTVTIVQVGFFANLARLLDTPPDAVSPLAGKDLVKQKVRLLSVMAGAFQTIRDNNRYLEYNIIKDIPSAQKLAREWPAPIVWSGFEIGIAAPYPAESIVRDFAYRSRHIVAEAYRVFMKMPYDRPTWDPAAALYGVLPEAGYFDLSAPGRVTVDDDGFTRFQPEKNGRDRFQVLTSAQVSRVREAMVQLASQPPDNTGTVRP